MKKRTAVILAIVALFFAAPVPADDTATAKGEIVDIRNGVQVQNRGEFDQLTIRARNGETRRLLLGPSGSCPDCLMVGDRVRAKLMGDTAESGQLVRTMKVRRTGETLAFRNEAGELIRQRSRIGDGAGTGSMNGSGVRQRQRIHQSGAAAGGNGGRARSCGGGRR